MLQGLGDEISTLVDDAIRFGVALPKSLQPYVTELARTGQLLDDSGNAITDLTTIKWEDTPLDKGTSAIIDAINRLGDILKGLPDIAKTAADGISDSLDKGFETDVTVNVHYNTDSLPAPGGTSYGAGGGLVTDAGVQYLAKGGTVGRIVHFRPRGIDTVPIMAAPGEGMVNRTGMGVLGTDGLAALNRGQVPGQVVDFQAMRTEMAALRSSHERLARYLQYDQPGALAKAAVAAAQSVARSRK